MSRKPHAADIADREAIKTATRFSSFQRLSPTEKHVEEWSDLRAAALAAQRYRTENPGRDALVYAILPSGNTVPVPKALQAAALAGEPEASAVETPAQPTPKARKRTKVEEPAPKPAKPPRPVGKRALVLEAAQRGELPTPPDFSAATHARFRPKLAALIALVQAGDIEGLRSFPIALTSSSPKAMDRFRNLAIVALEAR